MKSLSLLAVSLVLPLFIAGCHEEDVIAGQLMSTNDGVKQAEAAITLDKLVALSPTAAGNEAEAVPVWKTLSFSEDLVYAYAERIIPGEPERQFD